MRLSGDARGARGVSGAPDERRRAARARARAHAAALAATTTRYLPNVSPAPNILLIVVQSFRYSGVEALRTC